MTDRRTSPRRPTKRRAPQTVQAGLKVRLRGRDDVPLSIAQLRQALYELLRRLEPYGRDIRTKRATLYLIIVDQNGSEVSLSATGEWSIWPYCSAADELDSDDRARADAPRDRESPHAERPV